MAEVAADAGVGPEEVAVALTPEAQPGAAEPAAGADNTGAGGGEPAAGAADAGAADATAEAAAGAGGGEPDAADAAAAGAGGGEAPVEVPGSRIPKVDPVALRAVTRLPDTAPRGELAVQDASTLDATALTPLTPEVISRQATINIGTIGHVAHGKSTVVKAISGVQVSSAWVSLVLVPPSVCHSPWRC